MSTPHPGFMEFYQAFGTAQFVSTWQGDVFRVGLPRWLSRPYLYTGVGSVLRGGRWNVKHLIPALYFSLMAETAAAEADALARRYGWTPAAMRPQMRVGLHLELQAVLDLTDPENLCALGVTSAELTGCDWAAEQLAGRESVTQALGRAAFERQLEGLLVPSAQDPRGVNIVCFPAHLRSGSTMITHHEADIPFVHGL